jgi:surface antigen
VCERMNHYIQGGVGDKDGGKDDEEGSERRREAAATAAVQGAPSLPPVSWGSAAP